MENQFDNDDNVQVVEKKRWALFGLPFTFTKYIVKKDIEYA